MSCSRDAVGSEGTPATPLQDGASWQAGYICQYHRTHLHQGALPLFVVIHGRDERQVSEAAEVGVGAAVHRKGQIDCRSAQQREERVQLSEVAEVGAGAAVSGQWMGWVV